MRKGERKGPLGVGGIGWATLKKKLKHKVIFILCLSTAPPQAPTPQPLTGRGCARQVGWMDGCTAPPLIDHMS